VTLRKALTGLKKKGRKVHKGFPCSVGVLLNSFDTSIIDGRLERRKLIQLLDKTSVSAPQIVEMLAVYGFETNTRRLNYHRKRLKGNGCACPKPFR
jgi:hypothetical protein